MSRKKDWTPQAYNIDTGNATPMNVEQGPDKRTIFFGGPNVWNVPQDEAEEALLEDLLSHQGDGYVMRKLPLVKLRKAPEGSHKPDFWLPDREAIAEHIAANDGATSEEARDREDEKAVESARKFSMLARKSEKKTVKNPKSKLGRGKKRGGR